MRPSCGCGDGAGHQLEHVEREGARRPVRVGRCACAHEHVGDADAALLRQIVAGSSSIVGPLVVAVAP